MSMSIEKNFNRIVEVQRLAPDESGDGESYATHLEAVACHIQPLDESFTEDLTGHFGKDSLMFAASQDIVQGDRVIDGEDIYQVVGAENYAFLGVTRHMEIRIRKENA